MKTAYHNPFLLFWQVLCPFCLLLPVSAAGAAFVPQKSVSRTPSLESSVLPDSAVDTIQKGGIALIDDFLSPADVTTLRTDAQALFQEGHFITDAIAGYGKTANIQDKAKFDVHKDRSVCPAYIPSQQLLGPFVNDALGNGEARRKLTKTIAQVRSELSTQLDRPGMTALPDGLYNHELSYTRFGPGAYLKRHTDEHHEELKGTAGWSKPTRRSLSWLVYLNEPDWNAQHDGGYLRTYPRLATTSVTPVGSRNGDLQIGWLTPTRRDPVERPVFLDARRGGECGNCALYIDSTTEIVTGTATPTTSRTYLTANFQADPYLFLSTDWPIQHMLITDAGLGDRFHYVEPPKSKLAEFLNKKGGEAYNLQGERVHDVAPTGGTMVVFDSVALPHKVLETMDRDRWAVSGWFHEAQQSIPERELLRQQHFVGTLKT